MLEVHMSGEEIARFGDVGDAIGCWGVEVGAIDWVLQVKQLIAAEMVAALGQATIVSIYLYYVNQLITMVACPVLPEHEPACMIVGQEAQLPSPIDWAWCEW